MAGSESTADDELESSRFCKSPGRSLVYFLSQNGSGHIELQQDVSPGISVLRINHPEKRNAICGRMILELQDALSLLENSNMKALVVHGVGGNAFCSGMDLRLVQGTFGSSWVAAINDIMRSCLLRLHRLPMVTVAALDGPAFGGGAELATACDVRIATPAARIQFVHARLGISTAWGGATWLMRLVARSDALRLLAGSQQVDAQRALAIGLITDIVTVTDERFVDIAVDWVKRNFDGDVEAVRAMKRIIVGFGRDDDAVNASLALEREELNKLWGSTYHQDCVESHLK